METRTKGLEEKFCHECGEVIRAKAEICPKCGVRQVVIQQSTNPQIKRRKRVVAGLLAIFLGGFGIHNFYLGKVGRGVVYLLFFWTYIPAIVGLVEGLIYLFMSDDDFEGKYGGTPWESAAKQNRSEDGRIYGFGRCSRCGEQIPNDVAVCPECGAKFGGGGRWSIKPLSDK